MIMRDTKTVLVVGGDEVAASRVIEALKAAGCAATSIPTFGEGLQLAREVAFDAVLVDASAPEKEVEGFARRLREICPPVRIIILCGSNESAFPAGADAAIRMPVEGKTISLLLP